MGKILVIGARGRAGRAAVDEARNRGHEVTAVARTTEGAAGLVAGDVTDVARIAELVTGHDAVIAAVYDGGTDPAEFFPKAARALVEGLPKEVRLIWVGLASNLPGEDGVPLRDSPDYPQEYRSFFLAHQAALDTFATSSLDWVSLAPAGDFNHADPARTGFYRLGPGDVTALTSYADFAIALVDEYEKATHHRQALGVV